jgi:hypothetical protein
MSLTGATRFGPHRPKRPNSAEEESFLALWAAVFTTHVSTFNTANTNVGVFEFTTPIATILDSTFQATISSPERVSLTLPGVGVAGITGYGWRRRR